MHSDRSSKRSAREVAIRRSNLVGGHANASFMTALASLVRSMNCYYSNLIEGHDTHPIDIERALNEDFSTDHGQRDLPY